MTLPTAFCWTRFGSEAGEPAREIFARKELERFRNGGVFLWGIGSSIRPSLLDLVAEQSEPEVVFSPMKSKASSRDARPAGTALWTSAVGLDGRAYEIPEWSLVTSAVRDRGLRQRHYALVCQSAVSINEPTVGGEVRLHELRNLSNNTRIGSSQVTCVVRRDGHDCPASPIYSVALVAQLAPPYFVELRDPCIVPERARIDRVGGDTKIRAADELIELRIDIHTNARADQLPLALTG